MRRKSIPEQYFDFSEKSTLKVVLEYCQKYGNRPANDIFFAPGRSGIMLPCMERR